MTGHTREVDKCYKSGLFPCPLRELAYQTPLTKMVHKISIPPHATRLPSPHPPLLLLVKSSQPRLQLGRRLTEGHTGARVTARAVRREALPGWALSPEVAPAPTFGIRLLCRPHLLQPEGSQSVRGGNKDDRTPVGL